MSGVTVGKWLAGDEEPSKSGKTKVWTLFPREDKPGDSPGEHAGATLGRVKWHGQWRRYAFFPEPGTLFEADCLRAIAAFCEGETRSHRRVSR
jgi:hypothetical protein